MIWGSGTDARGSRRRAAAVVVRHARQRVRRQRRQPQSGETRRGCWQLAAVAMGSATVRLDRRRLARTAAPEVSSCRNRLRIQNRTGAKISDIEGHTVPSCHRRAWPGIDVWPIAPTRRPHRPALNVSRAPRRHVGQPASHFLPAEPIGRARWSAGDRRASWQCRAALPWWYFSI